MSWKRIVGIIFILGGIALLLISKYITEQVEDGKKQISSAQKKVDQGSTLFSLSPYTKGVGEELTGSAQKKIDAGKQEVAYYEAVAGQLKVGGIACLVVGGILFIFGRKAKH